MVSSPATLLPLFLFSFGRGGFCFFRPGLLLGETGFVTVLVDAVNLSKF